MGYNYYNYQIHLKSSEDYKLEDIKEILNKFTISKKTDSSLTLDFDGWKLWIHLASGSDVELEAAELAEWMKKPEITECNSRLEIYAEDDPKEIHYNDHLYVIESLSELNGSYVFDPVIGEFLYENNNFDDNPLESHQTILDTDFLELIDDSEVESYIKQLTENPNQWNIWHDLGLKYNYFGNRNLALKCYQNSVLLNPENGPGYHNIGRQYMDLEQFELAKENFLRSIELNPERGDFRTGLGEIYVEEKNQEKALELLRLGVELDPENDYCNSNLGYYLLVYGQASEALPYIEKAIELGDYDIACFNKAHVHLVSGEELKAVECYAESLINYDSETEFWADFDSDYEIMPQYGISADYYQSLKSKIRFYVINKLGLN